MHLLGPGRQQQLSRQTPEDVLAVTGAVGEQSQTPHARKHRIGARRIRSRRLLEGIRTRTAHAWNVALLEPPSYLNLIVTYATERGSPLLLGAKPTRTRTFKGRLWWRPARESGTFSVTAF